MTYLEMFRLDGEVAVVTGAGRGIGRAIALALAEAGADVVVAARRTAEIEAVAAEIRALGRKGIAVTTDVTKTEDNERLAQAAVDQLGRLSIFVPNAGGNDDRTLRDLVDTPDDVWESMIRLNLTSVFTGARAAVKRMDSRGGSIIPIVSGAAVNAAPKTGVYGAAKAGAYSLTKTLAVELAPRRIRVNAVAPGPVPTEMFLETFPMTAEEQEAMGKRLPLGRLGKPEDIAAAVLYLASPAGEWMTGQLLLVNGGHVPGSMAVVADAVKRG